MKKKFKKYTHLDYEWIGIDISVCSCQCVDKLILYAEKTFSLEINFRRPFRMHAYV
jgi:hypothetical protein